MSTLLDSIPCGDPATLRASCDDLGIPVDWWGKPNQFIPQHGRGPGKGWVLLTKGDLDGLDLTRDHTLTFQDSAGNPKRTLKKITILRARCLTPGHIDDKNASYLCDVVDRRHFLAQIPVDRAYNLRDGAGTSFLSSSTNSGTDWTWQTMVQDLCTTLALGTQTLPFTPDGTPENFKFFGGFAWEALNAVLDRIACTVKYDNETDTFSIIQLGTTTTYGAATAANLVQQLDGKGLRTWDAYWNEPNRGKRPEKVRVLFSRRPQPTTGASTYYTVDVTLAATTGVEPGTYVIVHDDAIAKGATGTPSNSAALATRAAERAADWLRKRLYAESRWNVMYRDFQKVPTLLDETTGLAVYDDRGGAMRTELFSEPDGLLESWLPYEQPLVLDDKTSADCNHATSLIRPGSCFLIEVLAGTGRCSCVPVDSTSATWDEDSAAIVGTDDLFGCPPGVVTTHCASGAPLKYVFTGASFTGTDCTDINVPWTLTWTSGETWRKTKATVYSVLTWVSGTTWTITFKLVADDSTLAVYTCTTFSCCASNTFSRTSFAGCSAAPASLSVSPGTKCGLGTPYTAHLDTCEDNCGREGEPRLRFFPGTGSGAKTIPFSKGLCGTSASGKPFIEFTTSDPVFCTGTDGEGCDSPDGVTVRVTCQSCANPDYAGPGYYCTGDGTCHHYTSDPGVDVELIDGPFATAEECSCTFTPACCDNPVKKLLCVSFSNFSGDATAALYWEWFSGRKFLIKAPGLFDDWRTTPNIDLVGSGIPRFTAAQITLTPCSNAAGHYGWAFVLNLLEFVDHSTISAFIRESPDANTGQGCLFPKSFVLDGPATAGGTDPCVSCPTFDVTITEVNSTADCDDALGWECLSDGTCIEVEGGEFATEAECLAACGGIGPTGGCCGAEAGDSVDLYIPDGANAGTYHTIWANNGGVPGELPDLVAYFTTPGGTVTAFCSGAEGAITLENWDNDNESPAVVCPTTSFDGTIYGSTGDVELRM